MDSLIKQIQDLERRVQTVTLERNVALDKSASLERDISKMRKDLDTATNQELILRRDIGMLQALVNTREKEVESFRAENEAKLQAIRSLEQELKSVTKQKISDQKKFATEVRRIAELVMKQESEMSEKEHDPSNINVSTETSDSMCNDSATVENPLNAPETLQVLRTQSAPNESLSQLCYLVHLLVSSIQCCQKACLRHTVYNALTNPSVRSSDFILPQEMEDNVRKALEPFFASGNVTDEEHNANNCVNFLDILKQIFHVIDKENSGKPQDSSGALVCSSSQRIEEALAEAEKTSSVIQTLLDGANGTPLTSDVVTSTIDSNLPNFYTPAERVSLTQILLKRHALSPSLYQPRLATLPATPAMRKTASTSSSPGQEHGNISPIRLQDEMISLLTQDAMIHMPNSPGKVQISVPRDESQPMELEV